MVLMGWVGKKEMLGGSSFLKDVNEYKLNG